MKTRNGERFHERDGAVTVSPRRKDSCLFAAVVLPWCAWSGVPSGSAETPSQRPHVHQEGDPPSSLTPHPGHRLHPKPPAPWPAAAPSSPHQPGSQHVGRSGPRRLPGQGELHLPSGGSRACAHAAARVAPSARGREATRCRGVAQAGAARSGSHPPPAAPSHPFSRPPTALHGGGLAQHHALPGHQRPARGGAHRAQLKPFPPEPEAQGHRLHARAARSRTPTQASARSLAFLLGLHGSCPAPATEPTRCPEPTSCTSGFPHGPTCRSPDAHVATPVPPGPVPTSPPQRGHTEGPRHSACVAV